MTKIGVNEYDFMDDKESLRSDINSGSDTNEKEHLKE